MKSFFELFTRKEPTIQDIFPEKILETPVVVDSTWNPSQLRSPATSPEISAKQCTCPSTIKHIVISGGGEAGFSFYTALRESHKAGFWNIQNIESVYGTSVGSIFAIFVALLSQFDWDIYDDFVLKRPWQNVFDINLNTLVQSIKQKGILGMRTVVDIFAPLFGALDIPMDITMADFYKITGVDLHIITAEITNFELLDISHTKYPEWKVIDAIYCSACLPILFVPHTVNGKMYIDGGTLSNYPVKQSLANGCNPDEILGFNRIYTGDDKDPNIDTLFDYLFYIIGRLHARVIILPTQIKNQIELESEDRFVSIYKVYKSCSDYTYRKKLMDDGVEAWRRFYAKTYPEEVAEETRISEPKEELGAETIPDFNP